MEAILIGRNSLCKGTESIKGDEIIQRGDYAVQALVTCDGMANGGAWEIAMVGGLCMPAGEFGP